MSRTEMALPPRETSSASTSASPRQGSAGQLGTTRSYRDDSSRELPCQASALTNSNGQVEILSKDGQGRADRKLGRFSRRSDGVEVVSSLGSVTVLAGLDPVEN